MKTMIVNGNDRVGEARVYNSQLEVTQAAEIERLQSYIEKIFEASKTGTASKMRNLVMECLGVRYERSSRKYFKVGE